MKVPDSLQYTKDHEWIRREGDLAVVGITDFAQSELGDIVFVELPQKGAALSAGKEFGTVESVKAVSEIFAPLTGEVVAVNEALGDAPETVNNDPYEGGWILKMRPSKPEELSGLMSPADYSKLIEAGGH